jgi:hypothetical protein
LANLDADVQQAVLEGMADQIYLQGRLDQPGTESKGDEERAFLKKYLDKVLERKEAAEQREREIE